MYRISVMAYKYAIYKCYHFIYNLWHNFFSAHLFKFLSYISSNYRIKLLVIWMGTTITRIMLSHVLNTCWHDCCVVLQRQGCVHGEELPYVFGAPLVGGLAHFPRNYTKAELQLAEAVIIYWTNFARTGWAPKHGPPNSITHSLTMPSTT